MPQTVRLSCLLALLLTGLAQGIRGSFGGQDPGPWPLELKEAFKLFQTQYNRSYSNPAEHARRLDIFARNLARAQQLQKQDLGTAEFGMTPFSDLTEEEFGQLYGHRQAAAGNANVNRLAGSEEWGEQAPHSCDWRKAGVISRIRDQGNCRCCSAMAVAGNMEALWALRMNQSVEVSVQELVDCDHCGLGCQGNFIWNSFLTVIINRGLASEKDYPYQGNFNAQRCHAKNHTKVAWIQDFIMLPGNEQKITWYLATHGPITVTINMALLQQYQKGVIKATPTTCDPYFVDHCVLLVGFGKSKSVGKRQAQEAVSSSPHHPYISYWILKNSWGANWGEKGYFRLHKGSNTCGITKYPLSAQVVKPSKNPVSCPP